MDLPRKRWIEGVMEDVKRVDDRITIGIATVDGKTQLKLVNFSVKKVQRIKNLLHPIILPCYIHDFKTKML